MDFQILTLAQIGGKLRHIYRRYLTDCFPTCIAMVSGLSHRAAIQLVHPLRLKGQEYTTNDDHAIAILRGLGHKVRKRHLKDFNKLNEVAIISLRFPEENVGHVAVWDPVQKKVLEPYRGYQHWTIARYKKMIDFVWIIT